MRAIQKRAEPQSLTEHRASGNPNYVPDYEGYQQKDDLRNSLVEEQGAICCYCLQRIHPAADRMKIEHWHCQSSYPDEQLDYGNLLGACLGGQGKPPILQHCDTKKGDQELARNPATPAHQIESFIAFLSDGSIESSDAALNQQLATVLNLNLPLLKRNRKATLDAFQASLSGRGTLSKTELEREAAAWSATTNGRLKEYCQVVQYWLKKRIARA
jgi:uncharacterized protein (TIGR02646 family)